jgi:hypothetical protein
MVVSQVWMQMQGPLNTQGVLCNGVMLIDSEAYAKKLGVSVQSITSNYVLDICGNSKFTGNITGTGAASPSTNPSSLSDYTLLNPLLKSLTKRIVFTLDVHL